MKTVIADAIGDLIVDSMVDVAESSNVNFCYYGAIQDLYCRHSETYDVVAAKSCSCHSAVGSSRPEDNPNLTHNCQPA